MVSELAFLSNDVKLFGRTLDRNPSEPCLAVNRLQSFHSYYVLDWVENRHPRTFHAPNISIIVEDARQLLAVLPSELVLEASALLCTFDIEQYFIFGLLGDRKHLK